MNSRRLVRTAVLGLALGVLAGIRAGASIGVDPTPAFTGAQVVRFFGPSALSQLTSIIHGRGVEGTDAARAFCEYGEIVWVPIRDELDRLNTRHVIYEQRLKVDPKFASQFDPKYQSEGIPLLGAVIGIHYAGGTPDLVLGAQYDSVVVEASPTITGAAEAFRLAHEALESWPAVRAPEWMAWPADFAARLQGLTRLVLVSTGGGKSFRFAWDISSKDANGVAIGMLLDTSTGVLGQVVRRSMDSVCAPQSGQPGMAATGVPQNVNIALQGYRNIWATATTERPGFSHEAHRVRNGPNDPEPQIEVYYGSDLVSYRCASPDWQKVGLLALSTVDGLARYEDWTTPTPIIAPTTLPDSPDHYLYPGNAAADAMWFTHVTMSVFATNFGWSSYSGAATDPARVTVSSLQIGGDNADFDPIGYPGFPNSVNIGMRVYQQYSLSACLDAVAHEWTHGIANARGLPYNQGTEQAQLHEGFADTIGHAVEWYSQPAGTGPEKAEWILGEDNPKRDARGFDYFRRVDQPYNNEPSLFLFHSLDRPEVTESHARGNALAVAFRLLVIGGMNPDCRFSNCTSPVAALGLDKASHILFRVLTVYVGSNNTWQMLVDQGKAAAYDLYRNCNLGYSAIPEQEAVEQAFRAIGYGSVGYYHTCP